MEIKEEIEENKPVVEREEEENKAGLADEKWYNLSQLGK